MTDAQVIGFYGHSAGKKFGEFSNFYSSAKPFEFRLPSFAKRAGFPELVSCVFAEKAIMAVKAALMGDLECFNAIDKARDPFTVKRLGRTVKNFDAKLWEHHLKDTAFEAVKQKFAGDAHLRKLLLETGDATLAEATKNDAIWGIGLNVGDPRVQSPAQWKGRNILGEALMQTRAFLRDGGVDSGSRVSSAEGSARGSHCKVTNALSISVDSEPNEPPRKRQRTEGGNSQTAFQNLFNKQHAAVEPSLVSQLLEMGFPAVAAEKALRDSSGSVIAAVEQLTANRE